MKIKAYGLKKCSTCQKALEFLVEKKVGVEFSDYSVEKPTKEQVARSTATRGTDVPSPTTPPMSPNTAAASGIALSSAERNRIAASSNTPAG